MRLIGRLEDQVEVRLSVEELVLVRNILHEMCNGMHFTERDFQVILDANRAQAEELLLRISTAIDRLRILPD